MEGLGSRLCFGFCVPYGQIIGVLRGQRNQGPCRAAAGVFNVQNMLCLFPRAMFFVFVGQTRHPWLSNDIPVVFIFACRFGASGLCV